jgi:hypothetical protein
MIGYFTRPRTKEELFNLRHATLRNVIERIFGVLKRRFRILKLAPEYRMDIQNRLPAALCALHNFIKIHDPDDPIEMQEMDNENEDVPLMIPEVEPEAGGGAGANQNQAIALRNRIADELWAQYQGVLHQRELEGDINDNDELDSEGDMEM